MTGLWLGTLGKAGNMTEFHKVAEKDPQTYRFGGHVRSCVTSNPGHLSKLKECNQ